MTCVEPFVPRVPESIRGFWLRKRETKKLDTQCDEKCETLLWR